MHILLSPLTSTNNSSMNSSTTGGNNGYGYKTLSIIPIVKTGVYQVKEKLGPPI
jgi:hypothetical protein